MTTRFDFSILFIMLYALLFSLTVCVYVWVCIFVLRFHFSVHCSFFSYFDFIHFVFHCQFLCLVQFICFIEIFLVETFCNGSFSAVKKIQQIINKHTIINWPQFSNSFLKKKKNHFQNSFLNWKKKLCLK